MATKYPMMHECMRPLLQPHIMAAWVAALRFSRSPHPPMPSLPLRLLESHCSTIRPRPPTPLSLPARPTALAPQAAWHCESCR